MPFVFATMLRSTSGEVKQKIEQKCKDIWVSMNGVNRASGLRESDVGGVVWNRGTRIPAIRFFYVDRGKEFEDRLRKSLEEELSGIVPGVFIEVFATESGMWFADPEWATKPCGRPHKGEVGDDPRI